MRLIVAEEFLEKAKYSWLIDGFVRDHPRDLPVHIFFSFQFASFGSLSKCAVGAAIS